jgi:hypothetical protein
VVQKRESLAKFHPYFYIPLFTVISYVKELKNYQNPLRLGPEQISFTVQRKKNQNAESADFAGFSRFFRLNFPLSEP